MGTKMILFLLTFLFLYGGINFYFFPGQKRSALYRFTTRTGPDSHSPADYCAGSCEGCRILSSRTAGEDYRLHRLYLDGFCLFFFFLSVSLELIRALHKLIDPSASVVTLKTASFWLSVILSFVLVVYGYIDAGRIRVKHLEIKTQQVLPENGKLRIVQISDVHVGLIIRGDSLTPILEAVKQANPDILVSTGDLLDGELDNIMQDATQFAAIQARYGKFAVLGNHEYYAGLDRSLAFTKAAGFDLLRDDVRHAAGITIFGEDDITGRRSGNAPEKESFKKALSEKHNGFVLLLKHQPHIQRGANFNLQLSGHTHGGQLFPFGLLVKIYFPKIYGLHKLGENKLLYISRGTGTWGPPVRVFAPPEITVIDLIGKK